jgi:glyoxylase-like metal-dependent hydrolase (beta-lactamase superfamily II)
MTEIDARHVRTQADAAALRGLTVLERGWLSSNNVLIHPAPGEPGAVLVDASHVNHAAQTVALVRHALAGAPLARIVNTHLHSDHCGGNAALREAFGAPVFVPPGLRRAVQAWDGMVLTYDDIGQRCARFEADGELEAGSVVVAGGRTWEVLAAPGHDPDSVMLFDRAHGVLISADALWEDGLGVIFPELDGRSGFAEAQDVLALIESLPVRVVIPGHGAPFMDVAGALARARSRLAAQQADPARHARHAVKVLVKYHLMEEGRESESAFAAWAARTPLLERVWARMGRGHADSALQWAQRLADELVASGALAREGGVLADRGG